MPATNYNFADLFESIVDGLPDNEALIVDGTKRFTYAQLEKRVNRLAHVLQSLGVKAGEHVGLYLFNGNEYVEGMLAALKIRAVPINVNYRYVEEELRYLMNDADLVAVIHERQFTPRLAAIKGGLPKLRACIAVEDGSGADLAATGSVEYEGAVASASDVRDFAPRSADDLFIIYTGGTTGMPKGVMWRHEDLFFAGLGGGNPAGPPVESPAQLVDNAKERYHATIFSVPPLIHGAAQLAVLITFNWGDRSVLLSKFDAAKVWELVQNEKVNSINIVGDAMARPMIEELGREGASYDASSLFVLASSGAAFSDSVKDEFRRWLPNLMMMDNFGSSETGSLGMSGERVSGPDAKTGIRFSMNERAAVLDDDGKPLAPGSGAVGRLALRGHIPVGYYKDEQKTAATFVTLNGERWVLVGDLGTVEEDGRITVFGRGSVCINTGGEKVYPEEVEIALKAHPSIYDCVVVGVPDTRWGERVAAIVELRPGHTLTMADLDAHARKHVAGYKCPRELHVVEKMVRSPAGKPDYPWAKALAKAGTHKV